MEVKFPKPKTDTTAGEVHFAPQLDDLAISRGLSHTAPVREYPIRVDSPDKTIFGPAFNPRIVEVQLGGSTLGTPVQAPYGLLQEEPTPINPLNVDKTLIKVQPGSAPATDTEGHLVFYRYRMFTLVKPANNIVRGLVIIGNGKLPLQDNNEEKVYLSGFDYLAECLAWRGFVTVVVESRGDAAEICRRMLTCMNQVMTLHKAAQFLTGKPLAFIGHSRAAEAAGLAAKAVTSQQYSQHFTSVRAVVGLAPYGFAEANNADFAESVLIIQGTLDDDVTTIGGRSFDAYTQAKHVQSRYFLWMFGCNHTQFIDRSGWHQMIPDKDYDFSAGYGQDLVNLVSRRTQQMVVRNYVTFFLLWKLVKSEPYALLFHGENRIGFKDELGNDDITLGRFRAFPQYIEPFLPLAALERSFSFEQMQQDGVDITPKNPALSTSLVSRGPQFLHQPQKGYVVNWNREGAKNHPRIIISLYALTLAEKPVAVQFNMVQTANSKLNDDTTTIAQVYLQLGVIKSEAVKIIVEKPQLVKLKDKNEVPAPFTRSILSVVRIRTELLASGKTLDFFFGPGCKLVIDFSESRMKGEIAINGVVAVAEG